MNRTMKKSHRVVVGVCATSLLFALACATPLWADRDAPGISPNQVTKNADASINYEGPGRVVILNNGWVLIKKGRDAALRNDEGEMYVTAPSTILTLQFDRKGLALVECSGELFLDRAGKQMESRGLSWHQVDATRFEEVEQRPDGCGQFSILALTGDLTLDYDGASGQVKLRVCGKETEDAPAQELTLSAHIPVQSSSTTTLEPLEGRDGAGCESPVCRGGGSCSFNGTCSQGKTPVCYCDGPNPVCECIVPPKKDHEIGPEPIIRP